MRINIFVRRNSRNSRRLRINHVIPIYEAILQEDVERPCNSIPMGSTDDDIGDWIVSNIIDKCAWNVNVMENHLLCFYLKCSIHENILDVRSRPIADKYCCNMRITLIYSPLFERRIHGREGITVAARIQLVGDLLWRQLQNRLQKSNSSRHQEKFKLYIYSWSLWNMAMIALKIMMMLDAWNGMQSKQCQRRMMKAFSDIMHARLI